MIPIVVALFGLFSGWPPGTIVGAVLMTIVILFVFDIVLAFAATKKESQ